MYKTIARYITGAFIKCGVASAEKENVYAYGFEILISSLVYTMIFVLTAVATKTALESFVFWAGFFIIRKIAGGYHAKTYTACHILFMMNHLAFIAIVKFVPVYAIPVLFESAMLASAILLLVFAPVDDPNKTFTVNEKKRFRMLSVIYSVITIFVVLLLLLLKVKISVLFLSFGIGTFSASFSVMSAKIIKKIKKENVYEKNSECH